MEIAELVLASLYLGALMGIAGLALMLFSLLSRAHRGVPGGWHVWAPKASFTAGEYAANRTGLVLTLAGSVLALLPVVIVRGL